MEPGFPVEACLPLAGQALAPPRFHATGWKAGQYFSPKDDPDRTQEHWDPPAFAKDIGTAVERGEQTRVDEIQLPRKLCGRTSFAKIVHGVLTEEQCAALLTAVNSKGFTPALINVGGGNQMLQPNYRDGHRVIVDNSEVADWLLAVLTPHLPCNVGRWELEDLNERLRFLCYTPGQQFSAHLDGQYERPLGHRKAGAVSKVTVQLYLHSVPEAHGGATTFFPSSDSSISCQPMAGDVLLFTQDLEHEGSLLCDGLKYTLRTEVMYRPK